MLGIAIEKSGKPPKAIAAEVNYSVDAIYKAAKGKRPIPAEARRKLSEIHPLAGLAVAFEATGYSIFDYIEGDRHPQTMLRRVEKEDRDVDEALKKHEIAWRTIDKQTAADLTAEDVIALRAVATEISQEIIAQLNLLIEWEDRYQLGLLDIFRQKNNRHTAI
jgi:hypothetical protein